MDIHSILGMTDHLSTELMILLSWTLQLENGVAIMQPAFATKLFDSVQLISPGPYNTQPTHSTTVLLPGTLT